MRIYIDENMSSTVLIALLTKAGHDVETPTISGLRGRTDPVQFGYAIGEDRVVLTANYDDFDDLHQLVLRACGNHPGVLFVRKDNDPYRDLTDKGIVTAIRKLEASGSPISNECIILNHWR